MQVYFPRRHEKASYVNIGIIVWSVRLSEVNKCFSSVNNGKIDYYKVKTDHSRCVGTFKPSDRGRRRICE